MKANEQPVLTRKWWDAGRARTLPKTGVGEAFKAYEDALKGKDHQLTRKRIAELDVRIKAAIGKADKRVHAETIAALQKCVVLLKKEDDRVVIELKNQVQKFGKPVVLWKWDVSEKVKKQIDPPWLKEFRGYELSLWLDDQLLAVLEKEGDLVTPAFMIEDAQKVGDRVVKAVVDAVKHLDAVKGKSPQQVDAQRAKLTKFVEATMQEAERELLGIPKKRWDHFAKSHSEYRMYQIKAAVKVTKGALGLVAGAAGIAATGGAALALGIVGMVRGTADMVKQLNDLWVEADDLGNALKKDLEVLLARYQDVNGQAKRTTQGTSEVLGTVLKALLGTDAPFARTLPKAKADHELWGKKVVNVTSKGLKTSQAITKTLARCDDLEKMIRNAQNPQVQAIRAQLDTAQQGLDAALNSTSDLMAKVRRFETESPKIKETLDELESTNPDYARYLEMILPAAVSVALSAADQTKAFTDATAALDKITKARDAMVAIERRGNELTELLG